MSSLYGNADDYKAQLRKLEQYCKSNPKDPPRHFVLAYQYLVIDSKDAAIHALQGGRQESAEGFHGQADARCAVARRVTADPGARGARRMTHQDRPGRHLASQGRRHHDRPDDHRGLAVHLEGRAGRKAGDRTQRSIEIDQRRSRSGKQRPRLDGRHGQIARARQMAVRPERSAPSDPGLSFVRVEVIRGVRSRFDTWDHQSRELVWSRKPFLKQHRLRIDEFVDMTEAARPRYCNKLTRRQKGWLIWWLPRFVRNSLALGLMSGSDKCCSGVREARSARSPQRAGAILNGRPSRSLASATYHQTRGAFATPQSSLPTSADCRSDLGSDCLWLLVHGAAGSED